MTESFVKEPYDEHWFVADFSKYFPSGEVIDTITVTCHEKITGDDVTSATIRDEAKYGDLGIEIVAMAGEDGLMYQIVARAVTVNGLKGELDIDMTVLD